MKIHKTGQIAENDFLFKTLYLTPHQYNTYKDYLEQLSSGKDVDFVIVVKNSAIIFDHYTDEDSAKKIEESNIFIKPKHVGDLGRGTYAIPSKNQPLHIEGLDNLCTYFEDYSDEYLTKITGEFKGSFGICVYGFQHEGYLLLMDGNMEIFNVEEVNVSDLLYGS